MSTTPMTRHVRINGCNVSKVWLGRGGVPLLGRVEHREVRSARRLRELEMLRVELDAMVARGELVRTEDGRYGLPEWNTWNENARGHPSY